MRRAKTLAIPAGKRFGQMNAGPATGFVKRLHARPRHGAVHAQAYGLGKGFFGGKARSQEAQSALRVAPIRNVEFFNFLRTQYSPHNTLAVACEYTLDGSHTHKVDPHTSQLRRALTRHPSNSQTIRR